MKLLVLLPALLLSACAIVTPVKREFPAVPQELKVACPELQKLDTTDKMSEVVSVVASNYGQYQECQVKVDSWIEWYNNQKQIFDSVK